MGEKIRVGVIGLNIGLDHVAGYRQCPRAELVAICDKDAAWLAHCAREIGGTRSFDDYTQMLAEAPVEAVSVCVPNRFHAEVTERLLAAGKHVLCEKPMATSAAAAAGMAKAAEAAGKTLMICHSRRFLPESQYVRALVDGGTLGEIYFARAAWRRPMGIFPSPDSSRQTGAFNRNWYNQSKSGGGVLRDLGPHLIDLALWMMNFPKMQASLGLNVAAFTPKLARKSGNVADAEDFTAGMVRFDNGAALVVEASFGTYCRGEEVTLELFGTRGGVCVKNRDVTIFSQTVGEYTTTVPHLSRDCQLTPQSEFISAIVEGRKPLVTAEQGVKVMEVIDALQEGGIRIVE